MDYTFHTGWGISFLVLLVFAFWVGWRAKKNVWWILVDGRGRYSLTHFQIVLWTLVILSSMIGVLIDRGFDPANIQISSQLLGLMGISAGSAVLSAGVKGAKDAPGANANVARKGEFLDSKGNPRDIAPRLAQIWLVEEGDLADKVVDITKYQNFIFTLVILGFYIAGAWTSGGLPELAGSVVALIGISHAGYVGAKVPDKDGKPSEEVRMKYQRSLLGAQNNQAGATGTTTGTTTGAATSPPTSPPGGTP